MDIWWITEILRQMISSVTVDDALHVLDGVHAISKTMEVLMERIQHYLDAKVKKEVPIGAVVFSNQFGLLGQTKQAAGLLEKVLKENRYD